MREKGEFFLATENPQMQKLRLGIEQVAEIAQEEGLEPYPIHFTLIPPHTMHEFAAYGLPGGFSHWTRGRDYFRHKTLYEHGLSRIYELVINTNPAQAFLLENNSDLENILVAAHVFGHVDFFANNVAFAKTNRQMAETALLNAGRIEQYKFQYGLERVEQVLDAALALEHNIDFDNPDRPDPHEYFASNRQEFQKEQTRLKGQAKTDYDDLWQLGQPVKEPETTKAPFPYREERHLLYFMASFSHLSLEDWVKDIIHIVSSESQYFRPQVLTKIMNEGWASFNHAKILRRRGEKGWHSPGDDVEWMKKHSSIITPDRMRINPYWLGYKIWEDIDRRCRGIAKPHAKKTKAWWGQEEEERMLQDSIRQIMRYTPSDQAFLANYLTDDVIEEVELFEYAIVDSHFMITDKDPVEIRRKLVQSLTNLSQPVIKVASGGADFKGNGELYLKHAWEGEDLDLDWASKTLQLTEKTLWGKPAHLETKVKGKKTLISCNNMNITLANVI